MQKLEYVPALDGLRGVLVMAIFFFHVGYPWASGAVLSLSVFFTLSGFLITRVLLDQCLSTGTVGLLRFYAGRLRRLLPAALLCVAFILVLSATALGSTPRSVRGDALATLGYFANWHFLFAGNTYAALFEHPSPFLHFWSLAVEEQFYFLFPLLVLLVARLTRVRRRTRINLRIALLIGVGISLVATLVAATAGDYEFVYYSTISRAGELLIGGVAATFIGVGRLVNAPPRAWPTALGVGALVGIGTLFSVTSPTSIWINYGGLTAFSLASVALIIGLLPRGPLSSLFAFEPLRQLGRISYGAYLYHWPIILWLSPERTGLDGDGLVLVQALTTLALATASFVFVEQPIRRGALRQWKGAIAVPATIAVLLVAVLVSTAGARPGLAELAADPATRVPAADTLGSAAEQKPVRVLVVGDSVALTLTAGLSTTEKEHGLAIWNQGQLGCSLERRGDPVIGGQLQVRADNCDWQDRFPALVDDIEPEVVVLLFGGWDVLDYHLDGRFLPLGSPERDTYILSELDTLADLLAARGARLVLLTVPYFSRPSVDTQTIWTEFQPWRVDHLNALFRQWAASDGDRTSLIDLNRQVSPEGRFADTIDGILIRDDGVHFTASGGEWVSRWLEPKLRRIGLQQRRDFEARLPSFDPGATP